MNGILLLVLLQLSLTLPSRTALENPAAVSPIPPKIQKDYDKLWAKFLTGKEDGKVSKNLGKLLKKQKTLDPALTVQGYIDLAKGDDAAARQKFTEAFRLNPSNRIALFYLAEIAYAHNEYARAVTLYSQVLSTDQARTEVETKRQRALLMATDELVRSAARAERENQPAQAEQFYRQALTIVPNEPTLHSRLADLLAKQNRKEEADVERETAEALRPQRTVSARPIDDGKADNLEDLGRWGSDIEIFHRIRNTDMINREQFAALVVRYFPQVTEFRPKPEIVTDIQNSWANSEIQTVVGIGLIPPLPNHTFAPAARLTRGELAAALARLGRLLGLSANTPPLAIAPDVASTNPHYPDVQLVLGYGVMALENSGSFNVIGFVSGGEAVRSMEQLLITFQQAHR